VSSPGRYEIGGGSVRLAVGLGVGEAAAVGEAAVGLVTGLAVGLLVSIGSMSEPPCNFGKTSELVKIHFTPRTHVSI